jgi:hypothetical protein
MQPGEDRKPVKTIIDLELPVQLNLAAAARRRPRRAPSPPISRIISGNPDTLVWAESATAQPPEKIRPDEVRIARSTGR